MLSSNLNGQLSKQESTTISESHSRQKRKRVAPGPTVIETHLRIDADFYAYRACQAAETELDWGDDLITIASNFRQVLDVFQGEIDLLKRRFDTSTVTLYFSDSKNFRKSID